MRKAVKGLLLGVAMLQVSGTAYAAGIGKAYVPTEKIKEGPGVDMANEDIFGENVENPVKYAGTIKNINKDNNQILFEAMIYEKDESGRYLQRNQEIILNLNKNTAVIDAVSGEPVALDKIDLNQPAYAWTDKKMTRSFPGQTGAHVLVVNIPADFAAPMYLVINDIERDEEGNLMLTDQDGARFAVKSDTEVKPYLTKNIVKTNDLEKGTKCMIWIGPAVGLSYPPLYFAEKIMIFAE